MTLEQLLQLAEAKKWPELLAYLDLSSPTAKAWMKILVTALIQVHHPDSALRERYGLVYWDFRLRQEKPTAFDAQELGAVYLKDFTDAYQAAAPFLSSPSLNDLNVAAAIRVYVKTNRQALNHNLLALPLTEYQHVLNYFGAMQLTKEEEGELLAKKAAALAAEKALIEQMNQKVEAEAKEKGTSAAVKIGFFDGNMDPEMKCQRQTFQSWVPPILEAKNNRNREAKDEEQVSFTENAANDQASKALILKAAIKLYRSDKISPAFKRLLIQEKVREGGGVDQEVEFICLLEQELEKEAGLFSSRDFTQMTVDFDISAIPDLWLELEIITHYQRRFTLLPNPEKDAVLKACTFEDHSVCLQLSRAFINKSSEELVGWLEYRNIPLTRAVLNARFAATQSFDLMNFPIIQKAYGQIKSVVEFSAKI